MLTRRPVGRADDLSGHLEKRAQRSDEVRGLQFSNRLRPPVEGAEVRPPDPSRAGPRRAAHPMAHTRSDPGQRNEAPLLTRRRHLAPPAPHPRPHAHCGAATHAADGRDDGGGTAGRNGACGRDDGCGRGEENRQRFHEPKGEASTIARRRSSRTPPPRLEAPRWTASPAIPASGMRWTRRTPWGRAARRLRL